MQTQVITVMGQRGCGKSSYMKAFVPSLERVLVYDPLAEYTDPRFQRIEELQGLYRYLAERKDRFFQVAFSPESDLLFDQVCQVFPESIDEYETDAALGDCWFVVEEVDIHANPRFISEPFSRLVRRGRHYGVSMAFTTRRPAEMNRILDTQSNRFVCFRMIGQNDCNYMRGIMGDLAGELKDLQPFHFIEYDGTVKRGRVDRKGEGKGATYKIIYEGVQNGVKKGE